MTTTLPIPPTPSKALSDRISIASNLIGFEMKEVLEIRLYSRKYHKGIGKVILDALTPKYFEVYYCVTSWFESSNERIEIETSGVR